MSSIATGQRYEELAIAYLLKANAQILHRNFHSKLGEIDIIARDGIYLVFIEVRYRQNKMFGNAAESVIITKQKKIIRTAYFYLQTRHWAQQLNCRFDVVAISNRTELPHIEWIKDAFHA